MNQNYGSNQKNSVWFTNTPKLYVHTHTPPPNNLHTYVQKKVCKMPEKAIKIWVVKIEIWPHQNHF